MKTWLISAVCTGLFFACNSDARDNVAGVAPRAAEEGGPLPADLYGVYKLDMRPEGTSIHQVYHFCGERFYLVNYSADGRATEQDLPSVKFFVYDIPDVDMRGKLDTGFFELHVIGREKLVYSYGTESGDGAFELEKQPCP
jgi:hypothetical protein